MDYQFHLRAGRVPGHVYVVCKLWHKNQKKILSTGISIPAEAWDAVQKEPKTDRERALLHDYRDRVCVAMVSAKNRGLTNIQAVAEAVTSRSCSPTLDGLVGWYLAQVADKEIKPRSLQVYANYARNLRVSALALFPKQEADLLTPANIRELYQNLLERLSAGTASKVMTFLRLAYKSGQAEGFMSRNPVGVMRFSKPAPTRHQLTKKDVDKLYACQPKGLAAQKARLMFLLSVESGAAYVDLPQIRPENVLTEHGQQIIPYKRTKTGEQALVPVRPALAALWAEGAHLHTNCNQDVNEKIKRLAAVAGIANAENMKFHQARKTFGQFRIDEGYSIEAVAAMMGHADIRTTQKHYCRPGLALVALEMGRQTGA